MKKTLVILTTILLLLSGCISQKTVQKMVKVGDNISIDYVGSLENGNIFGTNIEKIAQENNLSIRNNKSLSFTVGKGAVIKGLDEGVVGMRLGESKTLIIPPEKGYGQKDNKLIQTIPIMQNISRIKTFPKIFDMKIQQFNNVFGSNHKIGDIVGIPDTNINLTIRNITYTDVSVIYSNLAIGYEISQSGMAWNDTVIKIDDKNVTTRADVKKNEIIQFKNFPWNTTVISTDSENMMLKHNSIPDTIIQTELDTINIHFNDTFITADRNSELAGKTLIFNITIVSID